MIVILILQSIGRKQFFFTGLVWCSIPPTAQRYPYHPQYSATMVSLSIWQQYKTTVSTIKPPKDQQDRDETMKTWSLAAREAGAAEVVTGGQSDVM